MPAASTDNNTISRVLTEFLIAHRLTAESGSMTHLRKFFLNHGPAHPCPRSRLAERSCSTSTNRAQAAPRPRPAGSRLARPAPRYGAICSARRMLVAADGGRDAALAEADRRR